MEMDGLDKFPVFQAQSFHLFIVSTLGMNIFKDIAIFSRQIYNNVDDISYIL
jgi:hypothetical protein